MVSMVSMVDDDDDVRLARVCVSVQQTKVLLRIKMNAQIERRRRIGRTNATKCCTKRQARLMWLSASASVQWCGHISVIVLFPNDMVG